MHKLGKGFGLSDTFPLNYTEKAPMFVFADHPSLADQFIAELRDVTIQKDPMRFRRNLERLGELMAYEISKSMSFQVVNVQTPLGVSSTPLIKKPPEPAAGSITYSSGFGSSILTAIAITWRGVKY